MGQNDGVIAQALSCRKKKVAVCQLRNMDTARSHVDMLLNAPSHLTMRQISPHLLMVFPWQRRQIWMQPCRRIIVTLMRSQVGILVNKSLLYDSQSTGIGFLRSKSFKITLLSNTKVFPCRSYERYSVETHFCSFYGLYWAHQRFKVTVSAKAYSVNCNLHNSTAQADLPV